LHPLKQLLGLLTAWSFLARGVYHTAEAHPTKSVTRTIYCGSAVAATAMRTSFRVPIR